MEGGRGVVFAAFHLAWSASRPLASCGQRHLALIDCAEQGKKFGFPAIQQD
jgi:hypothetical protein